MNDACGDSVTSYLRESKKKKKKNAPGALAEIPLQHVEKTMVEVYIPALYEGYQNIRADIRTASLGEHHIRACGYTCEKDLSSSSLWRTAFHGKDSTSHQQKSLTKEWLRWSIMKGVQLSSSSLLQQLGREEIEETWVKLSLGWNRGRMKFLFLA